MEYQMEYRLANWAGHLTREDVECILIDFEKWWQKAAPHNPALRDRVQVARVVVSEPRHVSIIVNIVADAYRAALEVEDA